MKWPPVLYLMFKLNSKNEFDRERAAVSLGNRSLTKDGVPEALLRALKDEAPRVRKAAATAIGKAALKGIDMPTEMMMHFYILPALRKREWEDPDEEVKKAAAAALKRIRTGE